MANDGMEFGETTAFVDSAQVERLRALSGRTKASLVVLDGWEIGRQVPLDEAATVLGRSPTEGVWVNSQSVSRVHARIVRRISEEGEAFEVEDLGSTNGTFVNNKQVSSARLKDGDKIRLGAVLFKFTLQDSVDSHFHDEVHRRIHFDQLTGLLKLGSFRQHLAAEIRRLREDEIFTLAMTDLDGLKRVNDTMGHLAGAMTVEQMGAMIRKVLRPQDRAGLYGGDETIIMFPGTPIEEARKVAETLRATIEARVFEFGEKTYRVTISQGLAEWPRDGASVEQLIAAADGALYAAKEAGRNCVRLAGE